MLSVSIDVEGFERDLQAAWEPVRYALYYGARLSAVHAAAWAVQCGRQGTHNAGSYADRTFKLRKSLKHVQKYLGVFGAEYEIVATAPYSKYVHEGTRAHIIRPRATGSTAHLRSIGGGAGSRTGGTNRSPTGGMPSSEHVSAAWPGYVSRLAARSSGRAPLSFAAWKHERTGKSAVKSQRLMTGLGRHWLKFTDSSGNLRYAKQVWHPGSRPYPVFPPEWDIERELRKNLLEHIARAAIISEKQP